MAKKNGEAAARFLSVLERVEGGIHRSMLLPCDTSHELGVMRESAFSFVLARVATPFNGGGPRRTFTDTAYLITEFLVSWIL
jgi:hypothetical protein